MHDALASQACRNARAVAAALFRPIWRRSSIRSPSSPPSPPLTAIARSAPMAAHDAIVVTVSSRDLVHIAGMIYQWAGTIERLAELDRIQVFAELDVA